MESIVKTQYDVEFRNKRECEEETKIVRVEMLELSLLKKFVLVPILCILTCFTILLGCWWWIGLMRIVFYNKTRDLSKATHLMVYGTRKQREIIPLERSKSPWLKSC